MGSGRKVKEDHIDHLAGLILHIKIGNYVNKGDVIVELHLNEKDKIYEAEKLIFNAVSFSKDMPIIENIICNKLIES